MISPFLYLYLRSLFTCIYIEHFRNVLFITIAYTDMSHVRVTVLIHHALLWDGIVFVHSIPPFCGQWPW